MKVQTGFLPVNTKDVFEKLSNESFISRFSLVGGTALSVQLGHRQSEDLDFIFDGEKIPSTNIKRKIAQLFPKYRLIREEKDYQLDYFVNGVKLTFFSTGAILLPFEVMKYTFTYRNIHITFPEIIAVLKISAIAQRSTMRDYYDLYYLAKNVIPLKDIFDKSKLLLPNISAITYTETIVYTADILEDSIENHLQPKEIITKKEIADYFISEIDKLK